LLVGPIRVFNTVLSSSILADSAIGGPAFRIACTLALAPWCCRRTSRAPQWTHSCRTNRDADVIFHRALCLMVSAVLHGRRDFYICQHYNVQPLNKNNWCYFIQFFVDIYFYSEKLKGLLCMLYNGLDKI
jgi:hypothetical protein